jgi:DNA repair ATPase RecN
MTTIAIAQNRAEPSQDVLAQILTEIRAVRVATEQIAATTPRIHVVLGRLQLQEQRLAAANRRLEDVRDRIRAADRGVPEALKTEEAALVQQLAEEERRWSSFNQQLEQLERSLERK